MRACQDAKVAEQGLWVAREVHDPSCERACPQDGGACPVTRWVEENCHETTFQLLCRPRRLAGRRRVRVRDLNVRDAHRIRTGARSADRVGTRVGWSDGRSVGVSDGSRVGECVGVCDGANDGRSVVGGLVSS